MAEITYYPLQDIWFYLLVAFILEALAVYIWQYRQSKGALPLIGTLLNRTVWLLSLVVIGTAKDLESKLFWVNVQQIAATLPAFFWLLFLLQITHRERWITKRSLAALLAPPALIFLLLFSNESYSLYWEQIRPAGETLAFVRGFGNYLMIAYNCFLLFPILYISINWIKQCTGLRRRQAIIVTLAPISGSIGTAFWLFFQHTGLFSPLPLSSLISGLAWTYGFLYLRVINLLPLAQAKAVTVVGNGLAVIDSDGWIVDLNAAAATLLGVVPAQTTGKRAAEVFSNWPALAAKLETDCESTQELCFPRDKGIQYYELHIIKLSDRGGSKGKAFVWKEITAQKKAREQLIEQEKAHSVLSERKRIGREFHDGPGQFGSYFQMELQTIHILLDRERIADAKDHLNRLLGIAKDFNIELRETITGLKAQPSPASEVLPLLKDYLERYQRNYGVKTELRLSTQLFDEYLDHAAKLQLLRIIQEALNNIRKHAQAKNVLVEIKESAGKAIVSIVDDGKGFDMSQGDVAPTHYGLTIMRERAAEAGGALQVKSTPGVGTEIAVEIPLRKADLHESTVG